MTEGKIEVPMFKVEDLYKSFGHLEVLKGIDMEVKKGEVICIIGASGSGKSTFLRCLNYLEEPNSGNIYIDGELMGRRKRKDGKMVKAQAKDIYRMRAEMGMVFQLFNLWPHRNVLENVTEALITVRKIKKSMAIST